MLQIGIEGYLCLAPECYDTRRWPISADLQGREHQILAHARDVWRHATPGNRYAVPGIIAPGPNGCRNPDLPVPDLSPETVEALTRAQHPYGLLDSGD